MSAILKKVYSIYALVLFAALLFIALLPYILTKIFLPYNKQIKGVYVINSIVMHIWAPMTGFRFEIQGDNLFDKDESYVVAVNHYSLVDMLALAYGLGVSGKPLIKRELLKIPILGWIFAMASIPVDRRNKDSRRRSFENMVSEMNLGISILIFPEGTRNRTGKPLGDFKDGAFRLAVESGKPILPVVLLGHKDLSHPDHLLLRPGKVILQYLEPIHPEEQGSDIGRILKVCHDRMQEVIIQNDAYYQTN